MLPQGYSYLFCNGIKQRGIAGEDFIVQLAVNLNSIHAIQQWRLQLCDTTDNSFKIGHTWKSKGRKFLFKV